MGKTISLGDKIINEATSNKKVDYKWFYETAVQFRGKLDLDKVEKIATERNSEKNKFFLLNDICELFDWQKGRDKEKRNLLGRFSQNLQTVHDISSEESTNLIFNALKRINIKDFADPSHAFLSTKERRKAKKTKINTERIRIPKTTADKSAASKARRELRKEAKRLGITTAELKAKRLETK